MLDLLQIAPYTSVLLNGGFWAPGCPRLLTTAQLAELQSRSDNRLISIVDVSCDWEVRPASPFRRRREGDAQR